MVTEGIVGTINVSNEFKNMLYLSILSLINTGQWKVLGRPHTANDYNELLKLIIKEKDPVIDSMNEVFIPKEIWLKLTYRPDTGISMSRNDVVLLISLSGLHHEFNRFFTLSSNIREQITEFKAYVDKMRSLLDVIRYELGKELVKEDVRYTGGL